jgi:hypothetical protein
MNRAGLLVLVAAVACGPVTPTTSGLTPMNSCPEHPCDEYVQGGAPPVCEQGACIVNAEPSAVLVVALPSDSYFAPGRTFAVSFPLPGLACATGTCAQLPDVAVVREAYSVSPQVQQQSLMYSLNPQYGLTTVPVDVTYRPLWPPSSVSEADDAIAAGLPLEPVDVESIVNSSGMAVPGPAGSPSQLFETYMQPGNYLRSMTPRPPLDAILPPEVRVVSVQPGTQFADNSMNVDATLKMGAGNPVIPSFVVTRVDPTANFEGWTAFLRDQTSGQVLSNVVTLGSVNSATFNLFTNHFPPGGDALTNAELVQQPPPGQAIPTGVFQGVNVLLPQQEPYSAMPPPSVFSGHVSAADGTPVEADVIFESTAIYASQTPGPPYPPQSANYFYAAHASATVKAPSGPSTYDVQLPPGQYRVSVRPFDPVSPSVTAPAPPPAYAVTLGSTLDVPAPLTIGPAPPPAPGATALAVSPTQSVAGIALTADERTLAGAAVDAVPAACADGSTAPSCLPHAREATTDDHGTFVLWLDPGTYRLRVRPPDGSRLPWAWLYKPVVVGPMLQSGLQLLVPAPIYVGLTLKDPQGNAIVRAIVRVFQLPDAATGWQEMGRAITDVSGHYDMYLAPPNP